MNASPQDAERQVEADRARLDETVEALKDRLTPGQLFDEMSRSFAGGSSGEIFTNLGAQIRDNPLPLALIGAGVALLATKSPAAAPATAGVGQALADGKATLQDAAGALSDKVGQALGGGADGVRAGAGAAADAASRYGHQAAAGVQGLLEREPLVVAAIGLAVGAAIGAALPPTAVEDRLLGAARDDVVRRGQDLAAGGAAAVKAAADDVAGAVSDTLKSGEGDDRSVGEKVGEAAQAAVEITADHLRDARAH